MGEKYSRVRSYIRMKPKKMQLKTFVLIVMERGMNQVGLDALAKFVMVEEKYSVLFSSEGVKT